MKNIRRKDRTPTRLQSPPRALLMEGLEERVVLTAQPQLIADLNPNGAGSSISGLVNLNGSAYFSFPGQNSWWRSDGTSSGTVTIPAPTPAGTWVNSPADAVVIGSNIYFAANVSIPDPFFPYTSGLELFVSDGTAAGTRLVKDIDDRRGGILSQTGFSSSPGGFKEFGGKVYFAATVGGGAGTGRELWRTDGTSNGTQLFADLNPGTGSSTPQDLTIANGRLFFTATPSSSAPRTLYSSDGITTTALTSGLTVTGVVAVGNTLYFSTSTNALWKTDGTLPGTSLVASGFSASPSDLTAVGSLLYFRGTVGGNSSIFRSDGTSPGTFSLGGSNPSSFVDFGGTLYFVANDPSTGAELYRVNGSGTGVELVADIAPGPTGSSPNQLTVVGTNLFLSANDGVSGLELYKTAGGPPNATLVRDIFAGPSSSTPTNLTSIGSNLFFMSNDGLNGSELWQSDGTTVGTTLVKNLQTGGLGSGTFNLVTTQSGMAFFSTDNAGPGFSNGLYATNGQPGDAQLLANFRPSTIRQVVGDNFYFDNSSGWLYRSDGTPGGTILLTNTRPTGAPAATTTIDGKLAFLVKKPNNKLQAWTTDGTPAGTQLWVDTDLSFVSWMRFVSGKLFLAAQGTVAGVGTGTELWVTDGSALPTLVVELNPGTSSSLGETPPAVIGDKLYFNGWNAANGEGVWVTDASTLATSLFLDPAITTQAPGSPRAILYDANGVFYVNYNDNATLNPGGIWKSDGTVAGTIKFIESPVTRPTLFVAETGIYFSEISGDLYFSLGTAGTTSLVFSGQDSFPPGKLVTFGNSAVFGGNDGTGSGLWWTDSTAAGTYKIAPINVSDVVRGGPRAFFLGDDGVTGSEPWSFQPDNTLPTANAGGPYVVAEGSSLTLDASTSFDPDPGQTLSYAWDLNNDNDFSDAVGISPVVLWSTLAALGYDGPGTMNVRVRVTDSFSGIAISSGTSVAITNVAPAAIAPVSPVLLASNSFTLIASDPSSADQVANFTFEIDWDGDNVFDQTAIGPSGMSISHTFAGVGVYSIKVRATDKDGGIGDISTFSITVSDWEISAGQLLWRGSNSQDEVTFEQIGPASILIRTLKLNGTATSDEHVVNGIAGPLRALSADGDDLINASAITSIPTDLCGGKGLDTILGGTASDTIYGDSDGGEGWADSISGGAGNDVIYADGSEGSQNRATDSIDGGTGDDIIIGDGAEGSPDTIVGGDDNDSINGGGGNDLIDGGWGDDILLGGDATNGANDTISGGNGRDILIGDTGLPVGSVSPGGSDSLNGDADQDLIIAGMFVPTLGAPINLDEVRAEWTSGRSLADRIANISGTGVGPRSNANSFLVPGINLFNDKPASSTTILTDVVLGGADDADWLFIDLSEDSRDIDSADTLVDLSFFPAPS